MSEKTKATQHLNNSMIHPKVILTARQQVGLYLKSIRKEKKLTYYAVAKASGLNIGQVQAIEAGNKAYTFDSFMRIIHALDCYFFLEDKDGKHLDFADMAQKSIEKKRANQL